MATSDQWAVAERPKTLDDVVGQNPAVAYIRGMLKESPPGCIAIFGPTGTGKTTLGRLIAAHLSKWKGDPDKNPDVTEVPANVDRGIDDVRKLIQTSRYSPRGARRIMLIDEVHGYIGPAASALLKETEDPAPRTTWILVTDQHWKLSKAGNSRAQKITLLPVAEDALQRMLVRVAKVRRAKLGPKPMAVVKKISELAGGSAREAVQMLESVHKTISGGGRPSEALQMAVTNSAGMDTFPQALAYLTAILAGSERDAVRAVAMASSADGMVELLGMMLVGLIRKSVGGQPKDGAGWAAVRAVGKLPPLHDMLALQARLVAALHIRSQYAVASDALLFGLAKGAGDR